MVCGGLTARKAPLGGLDPESEPQEACIIGLSGSSGGDLGGIRVPQAIW